MQCPRPTAVLIFVLPLCVLFANAAAEQHAPENATKAMDLHEQLQVQLFASEPMLANPSNIAVDHRGRVWVCEIVNYRLQFPWNQDKIREDGDRILILEDSDQDGVADKQTVFYQGRDIDSPHGICILGNQVVVSSGSRVFVFYDDNGDDRADRKEVLFSGIRGVQHDHGIHAFVFGPDGKLYFNFGNAGGQLLDRDGQPITDLAGNIVKDDRNPYQQGMVFRCDLDGSNVETLGWNFRNNWEVAVDSFGTLWQSDNDDDGNFGTRINYVMEFGNYGYRDELTGAGWRQRRIGMHEVRPKRHWHLRDPGVIPNLLQTGAGSPAGICIYEGSLLPPVFANQMIHCDPGKNVVRSYPVSPAGAGYSATTVKLIDGKENAWFRPVDVSVAGDGSLFVADWYDAGVGGHRAADARRGRIFRVIPREHDGRYRPRQFDSAAPLAIAEAIEALQSPNLATRYVAWQSLHDRQADAEPALLELLSSHNPRMRARALWLLGKIQGRTTHYVLKATQDDDPNIRIAGLRIARQMVTATGENTLVEAIGALAGDPHPHVRRECAIALRQLKDKQDCIASLWSSLAGKYDGDDRWYLEALGIGARDHWDQVLEAYTGLRADRWIESKPARDIAWRSRSKYTPKYLRQMLLSDAMPESEVPRVLRAFDFVAKDQMQAAELQNLILAHERLPEARRTMVLVEVARRLPKKLRSAKPIGDIMRMVADEKDGTQEFVEIVEWFGFRSHFPELVRLAETHPNEEIGMDAARVLVKRAPNLLRNRLRSNEPNAGHQVATAVKNAGDGDCMKLLDSLIDDEACDLAARAVAARAVASSENHAKRLMELVAEGKLFEGLVPVVAAATHSSPSKKVREFAKQYFPMAPAKEHPMPEIHQLLMQHGDAKKGEKVFATTGTCSKCHMIDGRGSEVGPSLSAIGQKLSRQALYESILFPSAGINHSYEAYTVHMDDGTTVTGLKLSETDATISIRNQDGIQRDVPKDQVEEIQPLVTSLMPVDLHRLMTTDELVDLVAYLESLKKDAVK